MSKVVCLDFDGVIHKYSKGWKGGEIYDSPVDGAIDFIIRLFRSGYTVVVHTTRDPEPVVRWLAEHMRAGDRWIPVFALPPDAKFPPAKRLSVTNRKVPAIAYVDDRAIRFTGDWDEVAFQIRELEMK